MRGLMRMEEKVNVKQALRVYETIVTKGVKNGDQHCFNGLCASSDFDGYTITICNEAVSLTIQFHNKFTMDFPNSKAKAAFLQQLDEMDNP